MDIIILIDTSYSVQGYEQFIADAYEAFIERFDLSEEGIRIGAFLFNSQAYKISTLTSEKSKLMNGSEYLREYAADGSTNLLDALYKASSAFANDSRGGGVPKSLIIITDGLPSNMSQMSCEVTIFNMKRHHSDLSVYGIYIDNGYNGGDFLMDISDFYVSTSYQILVDELERLDMCF
jgi:uncharacterized protein with von Willebrand factor type A (vWA) domain